MYMYLLSKIFKHIHCASKVRLRWKILRENLRNLSYHPGAIILGIETSCDDTGCAVIDGKGNILGDSLYSQSLLHLRYGGVNPLVARDLHRDNIENAVNEALDKASINMQNIDAIAVTVKPGLLVSLQIGVKYAMFLSKTYNKPIIPIHHMEAHALVSRMFYNINLPFLALLISGGHCLLTMVNDIDDFHVLGTTLDNSPGEVLDKAARRMKLRNIPAFSKLVGGRAIELAATKSNNSTVFDFPLPILKNRDCNFTFSGVQDTLNRHIRRKEKEHNVLGDETIPEIFDLCASFQSIIAEHIMHRTKRAVLYCMKYNLFNKDNKSIVVSGGVACNNFIFKAIENLGQDLGCNVYRPPPKVCTDNGIMIAWNGLEKIKKQYKFQNTSLNCVEPKAPLGVDISDKVKEENLYVKATRLKKV